MWLCHCDTIQPLSKYVKQLVYCVHRDKPNTNSEVVEIGSRDIKRAERSG